MRKITPEKSSELKAEMSKPYYPGFNLKQKDIPEAKKWEVGKTYKLEMEVELKSIREDERRSEVGFDIKAVGTINKESKKKQPRMAAG